MRHLHLRQRVQQMHREDLVIGITFFALTLVMVIVAVVDVDPELLKAATGN